MADHEVESDCEEYRAREQARVLRLRLGLRWFAAVLLIAVLVGMMLGRLFYGEPPLPSFLLGPVELRQVESQPLADGVRLRLQFDRHTALQQQRDAEVVRISFPAAQLHAEQRAGRAAGVGWRLLEQQGQVHLLVLGVQHAPHVQLSTEYDKGRWYLHVEARLAPPEG